MRAFCLALAISLIILGDLGSLVVQASPGIARQAHRLVTRHSASAQAATADALQPDAVVLYLHPERHQSHSERHHRRHAGRKSHRYRIAVVPVNPWLSKSMQLKALPRRAESHAAKTHRDEFAESVRRIERCGFAPWVIDVYSKAARACNMLPHELVNLVATRAASALVEGRLVTVRAREWKEAGTSGRASRGRAASSRSRRDASEC